MPQLYIESKPVSVSLGTFHHLYLVYEDDVGGQFVLRGGPQNNNLANLGSIILELGIPITASEDARGSDHPVLDRGQVEISLGTRNARDVWDLMLQLGTQINTAAIAYTLPPNANNSNSVVSSLLRLVGIDISSYIPTNTNIDDIPGHENILVLDMSINGTPYKDVVHTSELSDTVSGGIGSDFIDGHGGADNLNGGGNNDTLLGDTGNDTLIGSTGDDILVGGSGIDTYEYSTGDGKDIISDRDGILKINGQALSGVAMVQEDGSYLLQSGGVDYRITKSGSNIVLQAVGAPVTDQITLRDFHNGAFGISLDDNPVDGPTEAQVPPATPLDNDDNYILPWNPAAEDAANPDNPYGNFADYGSVPTIAEAMQNANAAVAQASNTVVQQRLYDPLVADLDGDGIEMVGLQNSSVFFDLDTSNPGLEHAGWVSPKDGFFAIRPEGGQPIKFDNLLGNDTIDGFDELRRYDENGDRVMNASDPVFSNGTLVMWQDSNQDGVSSPGELTTMAERNITSIDLNERRGLIEENHGNIIIADSTMVMNNQARRIADVLLLVDGFNTISNPANSTGSLNPETLFLPHSRGYSLLKEWHVAMTEDPVLLGMVQEMAKLPPNRFNEADQRITDILYRWAGAEGVNPLSRGGIFDAQKLAVLEKFTGKPYNGNLISQATPFLEIAWDNLFSETAMRLVTQGTMRPVFSGVRYSFNTDSISFTNNLDQIIALADNVVDGDDSFWRYFGHVIEHNAEGFANKTKAEVMSQVGTFIAGKMDVPEVEMPQFAGINHYKLGIHTDSQGTSENDYMRASGKPTLYYRINLQGNRGNDVLDAGDSEGVQLTGGDGDDTYRVGDNANVTIIDYNEPDRTVTNTLHLLGNVTQDQITSKLVQKPYQYDWVIGLPNGNKITVENQFTYLHVLNQVDFGGNKIHELHFVQEGASWTNGMRDGFRFRGDLEDTLLPGTRGPDVFWEAGGGNTLLAGDAGYDVYYWGTGQKHGNITISEAPYLPVENRIVFDATVDPATLLSKMEVVSAGSTYYHWRIGVPGSPNAIFLPSGFGVDAPGLGAATIEELEFSDGTRWNVTQGVTFRGGPGNDTLRGTRGDDTLYGGGGTDLLHGDEGNDEYHWNAATENVTVSDSYGSNRIVIDDATVTSANIFSKMEKVSSGITYNHWRIGAPSSPNTIFITSAFGGGYTSSGATGIEELVFNDGTRWNVTQGVTFRASPTDTILYGTAGDDKFYTTGGTVTLAGDLGADEYHWSLKDGNITIASEFIPENRILLDDPAVTPANVLSKIELNVVGVPSYHWRIGTLESSNTIFIPNGFGQNSESLGAVGIEELVFRDGTRWNVTQGVTFRASPTDTLLLGSAGDDQFYTTGGKVTLAGGLGNDTYHWNASAGNITISEPPYLPVQNRINFDATVDPNTILSKMEVGTGESPYHWRLGTPDSPNTIFIPGAFTQQSGGLSVGASAMGELVFHDGTRWNVTQGVTFRASPTDTLLLGSAGNDQFYATGGMVTFAGDEGNDTYHFGYSSGNVYIAEHQYVGAIDKVVLGEGITPDKVTFQRSGDNLVITLDSGQTLTIGYQFQDDGFGLRIDFVQFADGTVIDMSKLQFGTPGNDSIQGTSAAGALFGLAGNDTIIGGDGGNLLVDGLGSDSLAAGAGRDTLVLTKEAGASEIIENFNPAEDVIDLRSFDGQIRNFGDLLMAQNGTDVMIALGGGQTVTLVNITLAELTSRNFVGNATILPSPTSSSLPAPAPELIPVPALSSLPTPAPEPIPVPALSSLPTPAPEPIPVPTANSLPIPVLSSVPSLAPTIATQAPTITPGKSSSSSVPSSQSVITPSRLGSSASSSSPGIIPPSSGTWQSTLSSSTPTPTPSSWVNRVSPSIARTPTPALGAPSTMLIPSSTENGPTEISPQPSPDTSISAASSLTPSGGLFWATAALIGAEFSRWWQGTSRGTKVANAISPEEIFAQREREQKQQVGRK